MICKISKENLLSIQMKLRKKKKQKNAFKFDSNDDMQNEILIVYDSEIFIRRRDFNFVFI